MEIKSRSRRNGLQGTQVTSCNHVDNAGKPRTSAHGSAIPAAIPAATPEVAGPGADHPPPAANPHTSAASPRTAGRGEL